VVYSTLLGGDDIDESYDVAVDHHGFAYITGFTASTNFPTRQAYDPLLDRDGSLVAGDAFVAKLDPLGYSLVYATYLGGSDGDDAQAVAADAAGNAYLVGQTGSDDFPLRTALQPARSGELDAFVTKISPDGGTLRYSTYLGGSEREFGNDIAVDRHGNAHIIGSTFSIDFPTNDAVQPVIGGGNCGDPETPLVCPDAYITKLSADGRAFRYSTYLGGNDGDVGIGLELDSDSNVYVTGQTFSTNFPTVNAPQPTIGGGFDAFVTKLRGDGRALVYSTYLGGASLEVGFAIAVDRQGRAYVTGQTGSDDFPTAGPLQPTYGGGGDAFVVKLSDREAHGRLYLPMLRR
jgi:hypothetical protein